MLKDNYKYKNEKIRNLWPFYKEISILWESGEDHSTCARCNKFFMPCVTNYLEEFETTGT
jgi:hypothetical protein